VCAYIVNTDFRVGVDRRRSRIAGTPGALWIGKNIHLTRGGEIEKRKKFVPKWSLPPKITPVSAQRTYGLRVIDGEAFIFGSEDSATIAPDLPSGVTYQRLQHPSGFLVGMTALLSHALFDGKIYAVAEFSTGFDVQHYYDGARVTAWDIGVIADDTGPNDHGNVTAAIAAAVNADVDALATAVVQAPPLHNRITLTAKETGVQYTVTAEAENGVGNAINDQFATVTNTQATVVNVPEVLSFTSFTVTGGTGAGSMTALTIDGVDVLGATVTWAVSNSNTAALIAAQINSNVSAPDYTAASDGVRVTISALAGTGAAPNGRAVVPTVAGDLTVSTPAAMGGGVTAIVGLPQIDEIEFGGTWEEGDRYALRIHNTEYGAGDNPATKGRIVQTFRNKIYAAAGEMVYFCAVADPLTWRANVNGAGFINASAQEEGSLDVIGMGKYQGSLAFFADTAIQIWNMDEDPNNNVLLDTLDNTGAVAGRSVLQYGNNDTFYLSRSGLRSLRARDATDAAFVTDPGNPIDSLLVETIRLLGDEAAEAKAIIDPIDGRYWLAIGDRIYVLSYFPGAKITAWSWYEPGFTVDDFSIDNGKVYVRSGDTVYLYGGDDGDTYDSQGTDFYEAVAELPFQSTKRIADDKTLVGYDIACTNAWLIKVLTDPRNENRFVVLGTVDETTYSNLSHPASGDGSHFAMSMTCTAPGPATINNLALWLEDEQSEQVR
jgi:hypothetical protein